MSSNTIATVVKMLQSLPEAKQDQVVEHLRDYIEDLIDELQWDIAFEKTRDQLAAAAQRAKKEIAKGHVKPLDYEQLWSSPTPNWPKVTSLRRLKTRKVSSSMTARPGRP